jgi:hypothetical protein
MCTEFWLQNLMVRVDLGVTGIDENILLQWMLYIEVDLIEDWLLF